MSSRIILPGKGVSPPRRVCGNTHTGYVAAPGDSPLLPGYVVPRYVTPHIHSMHITKALHLIYVIVY